MSISSWRNNSINYTLGPAIGRKVVNMQIVAPLTSIVSTKNIQFWTPNCPNMHWPWIRNIWPTPRNYFAPVTLGTFLLRWSILSSSYVIWMVGERWHRWRSRHDESSDFNDDNSIAVAALPNLYSERDYLDSWQLDSRILHTKQKLWITQRGSCGFTKLLLSASHRYLTEM